MNKTVVAIAIIIYNLIIITGTAWLVAVHDWSGWWFALTVAVMLHMRNKDD